MPVDNEIKAVVRVGQMNDDMLEAAIQVAKTGIATLNTERDIGEPRLSPAAPL